MIFPKCLHKKELAYTATGYLMPCCWTDNPIGWEEPQIKALMKDHLKVENMEIKDIINSKEWHNFFEELKTNPSKTCERFCSGPIDQSINRAREKSNMGSYITKRGDKKIKICCIYYDGKYTPDYVERLYNGLKKHCTLPFEFICYSNNPNVKADKVIPLPKHTEIKHHWHKLTFFNPLFGGQEPDDEVIIMDIDQVIVSNIDDMVGWPVGEQELISYNKWWGLNDKKNQLNGGWYKFRTGECQVIWDTFAKSISDWQTNYYKKGIVHVPYFGEQNFVQDTCKKNKIKVTLMEPEWVAKLTGDAKMDFRLNIEYIRKLKQTYMVLDKPNPAIKIIHFAGPTTTIPKEYLK